MAIALESVRTWFINNANLDMRTLDVAGLANGGVMVAFGGAAGASSVIYTALLNTTTDVLGALSTQVIPANGGVSTLRRIEIDAATGNDAVVTTHWFNAAINGDTNFSLATQRYDGATALGTPAPVNPLTPAEDTTENFSSVVLGNGRTLTFFTEPGVGGFGNLSGGIRMATFNASGVQVGGPVLVVGETSIGPIAGQDTNPEYPSAVLMRNGDIGLLYKQSSAPFGSAEIVFQVITPTGAPVGAAIKIAPGGFPPAGGILPELIVLDGGRMVAAWFDAVTGGYRGQMLTSLGALSGDSFALTTTGNGAFMNFDIVALGNGNFAVAYSDTSLGMNFAQIFDDRGKVLANPFLLLDSIGGFNATGLTVGLATQGDDLLAYALGTRGANTVQQLDGQLFDGDGSAGVTLRGRKAAETLDGGALDDRLDGGAGNDLVRGAAGQDVLIGGRGRDRLEGGGGLDQLDGGDGNDRLFGGADTDILRGGEGNDLLNGGSGRDLLLGGVGNDTLTGGSGADVFMFTARTDGVDVITDFSRAEGDVLRFPLATFFPNGLTTGTEANPTAAGFYFNTSTGMLSYDPDGIGAQARVDLVELRGVTSLSAADFVFL